MNQSSCKKMLNECQPDTVLSALGILKHFQCTSSSLQMKAPNTKQTIPNIVTYIQQDTASFNRASVVETEVSCHWHGWRRWLHGPRSCSGPGPQFQRWRLLSRGAGPGGTPTSLVAGPAGRFNACGSSQGLAPQPRLKHGVCTHKPPTDLPFLCFWPIQIELHEWQSIQNGGKTPQGPKEANLSEEGGLLADLPLILISRLRAEAGALQALGQWCIHKRRGSVKNLFLKNISRRVADDEQTQAIAISKCKGKRDAMCHGILHLRNRLDASKKSLQGQSRCTVLHGLSSKGGVSKKNHKKLHFTLRRP